MGLGTRVGKIGRKDRKNGFSIEEGFSGYVHYNKSDEIYENIEKIRSKRTTTTCIN